MCYADTGPKGGHGADDSQESMLDWNPLAFKLAS